jgi:hypothetical protein
MINNLQTYIRNCLKGTDAEKHIMDRVLSRQIPIKDDTREADMKGIDLIPTNKLFYKSSTKETFKSLYEELLKNGYKERDALHLLDRVYHAVANEYGD